MTPLPEKTASPTYEADFHAWLMAQVALLREGRLAPLDVGRIAQELKALGNSDRRAIESHVLNVLMHLLKWNFQPRRRTRSWEMTIDNGREKILRILADSPSLKPRIVESLSSAYTTARRKAAAQTHLPVGTFPVPCPFTLDQVLDEDFLDLYGTGEEERHDTPA